MSEQIYDSNWAAYFTAAGITPDKDPMSLRSVVRTLLLNNGGAPVSTDLSLINGSVTQTGNANRPARFSTDLRYSSASNGSWTTTGVAYGVAVPVYAGDVITNLTWNVSSQGAVTPTHQWGALYSSAGNLLAQSVDGTTTPIAAYANITYTLSSAQTIAQNGFVYAVLMVVAATMPGMGAGSNMGAANGLLSTQKQAITFGTGLTTTAPATTASGLAFSGYAALIGLT